MVHRSRRLWRIVGIHSEKNENGTKLRIWQIRILRRWSPEGFPCVEPHYIALLLHFTADQLAARRSASFFQTQYPRTPWLIRCVESKRTSCCGFRAQMLSCVCWRTKSTQTKDLHSLCAQVNSCSFSRWRKMYIQSLEKRDKVSYSHSILSFSLKNVHFSSSSKCGCVQGRRTLFEWRHMRGFRLWFPMHVSWPHTG